MEFKMNRAARRAAASGKQHEHRITQVHEAGHAIGRILAAEAYGIPVEESVTSIVMKIGVATCYGPMFHREITDALDKPVMEAADAKGETNADGAIEKIEIAPIHAIMAIQKLRDEGVDIDRWLKAKLVQVALGPCAEAKLTKRDPYEVFFSAECSGDHADANIACNYCSTGAERGAELIAEAIERAMALLEQPNVWRAILAVADLVPKRGTLPGDKIIRVATAAFADEPLRNDFREAA
jgi:hypothetical protein